jgi:protein O-mannosyl-transferase
MPCSRRVEIASALAIAGAATLAYSNSFSGAFVLDDVGSILGNPTIRHLGDIGAVLSPPGGGLTVSGRPILNLSFAVNYAISGTNAWSYHALNLAIHILASLTLCAVVREILRRPPPVQPADRIQVSGLRSQPSVSDFRFQISAFLISLIWSLHPLQTEAVTYVVQRAESLMSLFLLASAWAFLRMLEGRSPRLWAAVCAGAFILALATKENAISLLPILFLYDILFSAGSPAAAWKARGKLYVLLAVVALVEAGILVRLSGRVGQAGLGTAGAALSYILTQPGAVLTYLKLALLPSPLVFEYGVIAPPTVPILLLQLLATAALLAGTVLALIRRPWVGFAMACFWLLLAPTSLVPGTSQMIVEHRAYLALAPLLALAVVAATRWLRPEVAAALVLGAAALFSVMTWQRNRIYADDISLWSDTVAKRPGNVLAQHNLGTALARLPGRRADAIDHYRIALKLDPALPLVHGELGALLLQDPSSRQEAVDELEAEVRSNPGRAEAHNGLGIGYAMHGQPAAAEAEFRRAIGLDPAFAGARYALGVLLMSQPGRLADAVAEFEAALRLAPGLMEAHRHLAAALLRIPGREPEAAPHLELLVRANPGDRGAREALEALRAPR